MCQSYRLVRQHEFERGVCVIVEWVVGGVPAGELLHPEELRFARQFGARRRLQWQAGRAAVRWALSRLGVELIPPVLPNDRGAPVGPAGTQVTISHKGAFAAAFAARDPRGSFGIDLEMIGCPRPGVLKRVIAPGEVACSPDGSAVTSWRDVISRFALKEAVFKAADPFLRRPIGFREVEFDGSYEVQRHSLYVGDRPLVLRTQLLRERDLLLALALATPP